VDIRLSSRRTYKRPRDKVLYKIVQWFFLVAWVRFMQHFKFGNTWNQRWAPRCGHRATDRDHWAAGRGGSGGNAQVLAPQEIFFENGKIGAILGGGPPFFPPLSPPFSPLCSFPPSFTPGLHSTNAFKNLVLFALQCH
jgi:hypothetical protein